MVQRVYRQIMTADPAANIIIATSKSQVSAIHNQIGDVGISVEPCRRDTFPAVALASRYLVDVKGTNPLEPVVVCPVDPYVDDGYFESLIRLSKLTESADINLTLMGIEPTYPSEKYGYIIPESKDAISRVKEFKEKPSEAIAQSYMEQGALWNGGVFAYKLQYLLDKADELVGYHDYESLFSNYASLPKISFDYAVVEKEPKIQVLRFNGSWKDIGTWNTLAEAMDEKVIGDGRIAGGSSDVNILNELDMPILAMGVKNVIISASPEGILVSDKNESSYIKPFVDEIHRPVKFAEKSWGSYKVIDVDDTSLVIKITLNPGNKMNYHSHERRDEVWTVISGSGKTIVDGMEQEIKTGNVITMGRGCRHTVLNTSNEPLKLIETQLGQDISVKDKHKYDMPT